MLTFVVPFLCCLLTRTAMGQGFLVAASGTASDANVLVKFSVNGEVLQKVELDDLYSNSAYDPANRIVYLSGISDQQFSVIAAYDADSLKPVRDPLIVPGDNALLDVQFDRVTNSLLALTSDENAFLIASVNLTTGKATTLATLPEDITSISGACEAFDDVKGVYWVAALPERGSSGWLPIYTRTGRVGELINVSDWVQNAVWDNARQSLCGTWTDDASIACTNVTSATTHVFTPQLNFTQQGFRLLGPAAIDQSTQNYYTVFETHAPVVSWVRADLTTIKPFAVNIDKYFVSTMVFVPNK